MDEQPTEWTEKKIRDMIERVFSAGLREKKIREDMEMSLSWRPDMKKIMEEIREVSTGLDWYNPHKIFSEFYGSDFVKEQLQGKRRPNILRRILNFILSKWGGLKYL